MATRGDSHVIMAFDLEHERFQVVELPKNIIIDAPNYHQISIHSYGDGEDLSLSLCVNYYDHCEN